MSASAKPCVHGFWRSWMARVGAPVMMRTTVSLFIRKFTPGDATSRRDVLFAVGVRDFFLLTLNSQQFLQHLIDAGGICLAFHCLHGLTYQEADGFLFCRYGNPLQTAD